MYTEALKGGKATPKQMKELSFVFFASRQSALLKGGENLMHACMTGFYHVSIRFGRPSI